MIGLVVNAFGVSITPDGIFSIRATKLTLHNTDCKKCKKNYCNKCKEDERTCFHKKSHKLELV